MTRSFSPLRVAVALACVGAIAIRSCAIAIEPGSLAVPKPLPAPWHKPAPVPTSDAAFTSTREVSALLVHDGLLWAATRGGVLRRDTKGFWRKWSRRDGLPSHEAREVSLDDKDRVSALFPLHRASWDEAASRWEVQPLAVPEATSKPKNSEESEVVTEPTATRTITWREQKCIATLDGLSIDGKKIELPPSDGTHISALLSTPEYLWAAMFGEGLWKWDGKKWSRAVVDLPDTASEVTALAGSEADLWVGTRREGVWHREKGQWTQHIQKDEPLDANVQSLALFRGVLWMSTLEDGLEARVEGGWKCLGVPTLSSNAPRQMTVFNGALYVRHGGGAVDRFDGSRWARNVFPWLPRGKTLGLASDNKKLIASQWGGWSEWDGTTWKHVFAPETANLPLPTLLVEDDALWLGTQSRGLARQSSPETSLQWHDERQGLADDWITSLARSGPTLAAGTFVGGMSLFDGKTWSAPILDGDNVTALEADTSGGFFIATRRGTWHRTQEGAMSRVGTHVDEEAQALLRQGMGLWIGTRTGLFWVADATPST